MFKNALPAWTVLNTANDATASGISDPITGAPYQGGALNLGDYFDIGNQQAYQNCKPSVGVLYAGRYRRIQVDSSATAANVKTGTIGLMPNLAAIKTDGSWVPPGTVPSLAPSANVVTSYDKGLAATLRPVVFLNSITPGNFGWVQELGFATVLAKNPLTNATPAVGDIIVSAATGVVDDPTQSGSPTYAQWGLAIGVAIDVPAPLGGLFRVLLELPTLQE